MNYSSLHLSTKSKTSLTGVDCEGTKGGFNFLSLKMNLGNCEKCNKIMYYMILVRIVRKTSLASHQTIIHLASHLDESVIDIDLAWPANCLGKGATGRQRSI